MSTKPLVSVVTPAYNCEKYLHQTVESVMRQTFEKWEMIIVDDCSTDGTLALALQLAAQEKRIRVIRNEINQGVSLTRNRGIAASQGEYIALLDGDDLWESDKLERQVQMMEKGYDLVYCSYDFYDEGGCPIEKMKPFIVPQRTDYRKMLVSSVVSCSTAMARAGLLKEHPFRKDTYHEDYALWMELFALPVRAAGDEKVLMHYRQVRGSRSNAKGNSAKKRWEVYRRTLHMGLLESAWAFCRYAVRGAIKYFG